MSDPYVQPKEGSVFRHVIGFICVIGSMVGFGGLYFVAVPTGNRDALMLALGIVFGWGSAVVQSEYGASTSGRRAAESAIKRMEKVP
jgi:drug/metabolite transporter (DMT)-like permease